MVSTLVVHIDIDHSEPISHSLLLGLVVEELVGESWENLESQSWKSQSVSPGHISQSGNYWNPENVGSRGILFKDPEFQKD